MNGRLLISLVFSLVLLGCDEVPEEKRITLQSGETYTYDLNIYGDEEGAVIKQHAKHYELNELVRDSSTNWSVVYRYAPVKGYIGKDYVEIETCTGGEGIVCSEIGIVSISFNIIQ